MALHYMQFVLVGLLLGFVAAIDDQDVGNANKYIDTVLENLRNEPEIKKYMDPFDVPGLSGDKYNLRNIKVRGLSNLYRQGDCSLSYKDKTVKLVAEIAVRDVSVTMDYSAKAWFFWIHGDGLLSVKHLSVEIDISSTDGNARVHSLKVTNLGATQVERINGLSFVLNWLLKIIANNLAQNARGNIISALENQGKDALNDILSQYKLPIF